MSTVYDRNYYKNYEAGSAGLLDYETSTELRAFFKNAAQKIVEIFHPATVLDAGCAMGFLVAELRELGVEAYGIDISDYAVAHADARAKPYCAVCALQDKLPDSFPRRFDLVTNIEVMEHLSREDGSLAIRNLCTYADRIVFSSTSTGMDEPTHINVNTADYWASEFARHGFFNRVDCRPAYISADAYCFERGEAPCAVARYEKQHIQLSDRNKALEDDLETAQLNCALAQADCADLEKENARLKEEIKNNEKEMEKLNENYASVSASYNEVLSSQYWRLTAPMRKVTQAIKLFLFRFAIFRCLFKGLSFLLRNGIRATWRRTKEYIRISRPFNYCKITKARRADEEAHTFDRDIKFSVLVPLYNTPIRYLKEMIESVQAQTYKNWELCLADGSDAEHTDVEECVQHYAKGDSRIVYKKLEKNLGISENTNRCIEMADGDYIALFDHDDILHPSALFENMKKICKENADFLYTDEATFEGDNISKIITFHFKPDYAIDNLRANNYICHFSVFSKKLLEKVGMFRSEFDGSQDHDMILRLTAGAEKICHIPKLLYFWRSHPASVAADISSKTYAIDAGKRAVRENILESTGCHVTVESSPAFPTIYRIKYPLEGTPPVSIIIPNNNHLKDLRKCLTSVFEKTTYSNYEIVIVENGSTDPHLFEYYSLLKKQHSNVTVSDEYKGDFNYSAINNLGVRHAKGEYLILLNNDTEIITPDWIQEMLMFAQRPDVGAVGAKLRFSDGSIQHAGIILGLGQHRIAGHSHYGQSKNNSGYFGKLYYAQDVSAVTGACLMVKRSLYNEVGGLDESFKVAFNDVDFCLKLREKGYLNVFTPFAELYHYESKSRGMDTGSRKQTRFNSEVKAFSAKWGESVLDKCDPYYNPNFTLTTDYQVNFSKLRKECCE